MNVPTWLHALFVAGLGSTIALFGLVMRGELARPVTVEQRLVPELDLVDRCETCHAADDHPGGALDAHPVERFGCTTCHGGQGLATTREAAHERSLDWEWPLHTDAERESACGACHLGPVEGAPALARGRAAISDRGCAGCHDIPGYELPDFAPELDGLATKTTPGWVRTWLAAPDTLNAVHRMPVFDLAEDEREALVAFLWGLPGPRLVEVPEGGDPERGRLAIAERRCATCHRIGGRGGVDAPDLGMAGAKISPSWLYSYLLDTHRLHPRTRMPGFRIPAGEAADIVAYAREQWIPDTASPPWAALEGPVRAELADAGRALFAERGCAGCHPVQGVERTRLSVALSSLGSRRILDMPPGPTGALPDIPSWIATKVRQPHAFDATAGSPAAMPAFTSVAEDEALAIGVALGALRARTPPASYLVRPQGARVSLPAGETGRIVSRHRCLVCHSIGDEGGEIARVPLDGEGARVLRSWLVGFLQRPVTIRMDQAERMPVLGISAEEAERLAAWIETALGDDAIPEGAALGDPARGRARFAAEGCPACHVLAGTGEMGGPVLDGAGSRLDPDYVVALLTVGPSVVPGGRHPDTTLDAGAASDVAAWILTPQPEGDPR